MMRFFREGLLLLLLVLPLVPLTAQEDQPRDEAAGEEAAGEEAAAEGSLDMESISAQEEFMWGVSAFHRGYFNKAILSLEKSLAAKPEAPLTHLWLGRAYYQSGFEDAALSEWNGLIERDSAPAFLNSFVEVVEARRGLERELFEPQRYVLMHEIAGLSEEYTLFTNPSGIAALPDGSFYLVGHSSNEVLLINANGAVEKRFWGGVRRFDRPFDVLPLKSGGFVVTEYGGDRIAVCNAEGTRLGTYGESGSGEGQFYGPQFIAQDDSEALYISDWGNRRVVKMTPEGEFLFTFGGSQGTFSGLQGPTGVAVLGDTLYVADRRRQSIEVFDLSGNWLRSLGEGVLSTPEGITASGEDSLLIADGTLMRRYSLQENTFSVMARIDEEETRLLKGDIGANGNLVTVDFRKHQMKMLTDLGAMYSGLFVRIDRVYSDDFPRVVVDVTVETRLGDPVVGLDFHNFYVTEESRSVGEFEVIYRGFLQGRPHLAVVMGTDPSLSEKRGELREGLRGLVQAAGSSEGAPGTPETPLISSNTSQGTMRLIVAEEDPLVKGLPSDDLRVSLERWFQQNPWTNRGQLDSALRLAVSELVALRGKRAIVYFASGREGDEGFSRYGLVETMQFMRNNGVSFYAVYMDERGCPEELKYLSRETGGQVLYLYRPEGIGGILDEVMSKPTGTYSLSYESSSSTDFGRAYIPLEVETFLIRRSGRDESGYFAPLN